MAKKNVKSKDGKRQVNMWLPSELVSYLDEIAGDMGITRRKLVELLLQEFKDIQLKADDKNSLFGRITETYADQLVQVIQDKVEERMRKDAKG